MIIGLHWPALACIGALVAGLRLNGLLPVVSFGILWPVVAD
jgi:hypothetical protein